MELEHLEVLKDDMSHDLKAMENFIQITGSSQLPIEIKNRIKNDVEREASWLSEQIEEVDSSITFLKDVKEETILE